MSRAGGQRRCLDAELVRRGLCASRTEAQRAIAAGRVRVAGAPAIKPDRQVLAADAIELMGVGPRYVGRGGAKLEGALATFALDPTGRRAIDVGSSTGGFTDCLLQHGAVSVVAIDVGYGQLHERLRADPRVSSFERTNVRNLDPAVVGGPAPLVVVDVSFISLRTVADALFRLLEPGGDLITLVKPQFEAGRAEASKGRGVIGDPDIWRRVLAEVGSAFSARGAAMMGAMVSPLVGADGNVEFLTHYRSAPAERSLDHPPTDPTAASDEESNEAAFDQVVAAAVARTDGPT
jgi:23S rRNA (cytidine1920-2'-O)/16S rRNA (cytidine1409-2'-O)-methyltransferase